MESVLFRARARCRKSPLSVDIREMSDADFSIPDPGPGAPLDFSQLPIESPQGSFTTILLADDNPGLRNLISHVLKEQGFPVIETENGAEALTMFEQNQEKIGLVVSDIMMPFMTGTELFGHIRHLAPSMRFLFISSHPVSEIFPEGVDPVCEYLEKPFSPRQFLNTLSRLLPLPEPTLVRVETQQTT